VHDPPEQVPGDPKQLEGGLVQVTPAQGVVWQALFVQAPPEQVIVVCW
jgi:hypothetical protein